MRKDRDTLLPVPPTKPHRVVVLVRDGVLAMELGIVHRVFGQAVDGAGRPLYQLTTCTARPGEIRTDGDFTVGVTRGLQELASADTVIVPAADSDKTLDTCPDTDELVNAIARISRTVRIATICTGAFLVAAAGRLDGHRATTHWNAADLFTRVFPGVAMEAGVLYTDDRGILTSAGVASGVDLCLHMVRCDHGAAVANDVARQVIAPPHREGRLDQFLRSPLPSGDGSATVRAREMAQANLHRPLSLTQLAAEEHTSTRTLTRRFRDEVGTTPIRWITRLRVERALVLLETTDQTVDEIAAACGFGTATSMRLHLRDEVGISPTLYRKSHRRSRQAPDQDLQG